VPDHRSEIDKAVFELRSNITHSFDTIMVNGQSVDCCVRCGKPRSETTLQEAPYQLPCRGFI